MCSHICLFTYVFVSVRTCVCVCVCVCVLISSALAFYNFKCLRYRFFRRHLIAINLQRAFIQCFVGYGSAKTFHFIISIFVLENEISMLWCNLELVHFIYPFVFHTINKPFLFGLSFITHWWINQNSVQKWLKHISYLLRIKPFS